MLFRLFILLASTALLAEIDGGKSSSPDDDSRIGITDYLDSDSYPTLLHQTDALLYVGYRDGFLIWNKPRNVLVANVKWKAAEHSRKKCHSHSQCHKKKLCRNFVHVYIPGRDNTSFWICGSHAMDPRCNRYEQIDGVHKAVDFVTGWNITIFTPEDQFTYQVLPGSTRKIIAGAYADSEQKYPLITGRALRSNQAVSTNPESFVTLKNPKFLASFLDTKYAYFVINEHQTQAEIQYYSLGENVRVARIARVCLNDPGTAANSRYTSFVKIPLICRKLLGSKYAYNKLEVSTSLLEIRGKKIFFAIFSELQVDGTRIFALCGYSLENVHRCFSTKQFRLEPGTLVKHEPSHFSIRSILDKCIPVTDPFANHFIATNPVITTPAGSTFDPVELFVSKNGVPTSLLIRKDPLAVHEDTVNIFVGTENGQLILFNLDLKSGKSKFGRFILISEDPILAIASITREPLKKHGAENNRGSTSNIFGSIMITTKSEVDFVVATGPSESCNSHANCKDCLSEFPWKVTCYWNEKNDTCQSFRLPVNMDSLNNQMPMEACITSVQYNYPEVQYSTISSPAYDIDGMQPKPANAFNENVISSTKSPAPSLSLNAIEIVLIILFILAIGIIVMCLLHKHYCCKADAEDNRDRFAEKGTQIILIDTNMKMDVERTESTDAS